MTTWIEWALRPENKPLAVASYLEYQNWMEHFLASYIKRNKELIATMEPGAIRDVLIRGKSESLNQLAKLRRERDELLAYARREGISLPGELQLAREKARFRKGAR